MICVLGFVASCAFLYEVAAQPETYTWNSVSIGGGGFVTGLIPSKTEQGLIYSRTDVGGAYRWDAANNNWVPLLDWVSDGQVGYLGVESIALDPQAANKVYMLVGTSYFNNGNTAILISSDYGNTFTVVNVSSQFRAHGNGMGRQSGEKLMVDPNLGSVLYCGTRSNGLFKSTNSGAAWNRLTGLDITTTTNGNGVSFVVSDPSTGTNGSETQTIIAGISRTGSNIYRSDNGGTTFAAIAGGPTTLMPHRAVLASDRNLYITYANNDGPWNISGAGQVWKYNLQSGTWTNVTPVFAGAYGGISVDPANPNRLVLSSLNTYLPQDNSFGDRIFLSTNGGTSWIDVVERGFDLDPNGITWVDGHAIHWAGSIEFDPFDTKKAWVVSGNGIFRTDDIDATTNVWKFQVKGLEETVPLDIASIPNGPLVSVIGDYDGFIHNDVTQYAPIHTPRMGTTTGLAVAAQNPAIILRVGERTVNSVRQGRLFYSTNRGASWTECATASGPSGHVAISADGDVFLHGPASSTAAYRSVNRGTTWTTISGLTINGGVRPVADPVNPKKFYAYNSVSGALMVSTDGGISFSATGNAGTNGSKVIRTAPGHEGDVWIALYGNGLTRSVNSGESFTKLTNVTYCGAVGFGKEAPGQTYPAIYIWGTVNDVLGIHRSTDEGITWARVNDDAHEYGGPGNGQFVIGDMNVYGRVYMSTVGRGIVYGESDQTCIPTWVVPNLQVNGGASQQATIATTDENSSITLSPEATSGGSWSWTGPNEFASVEREITISGIQPIQGGIYTVRYTNAGGCVSAAQTFTVNINLKAQSITVRGTGNNTSISQKSGTLQMIAEVTPANAANKSVTWSITSGTGLATLSTSGLLTAIADGTVTVRATANDGSGVFGETQITITNQIVTSVEATIDLLFGIYPNPMTTEVVIKHSGNVKHVSFFDMKGKAVKAIVNEQSFMVIPVNDLPSGLYIMELTDQKNKRYNKRIVKY